MLTVEKSEEKPTRKFKFSNVLLIIIVIQLFLVLNMLANINDNIRYVTTNTYLSLLLQANNDDNAKVIDNKRLNELKYKLKSLDILSR